MKSQICLIRHGITTGNARRLYYGSTDVPLADKGIRELKELTAEGVYPSSPSAQFFTTGLIRTEQTLELIYGKQPFQVVEDLQEIDFGAFEMKSYEELMAYQEYRDWITATNETKAPPGGESIRHFKERVIRGFQEVRRQHSLLSLKLRHHEEDAMSIVICHGGTISSVLDYLWPGEHDNMYGWIPDPGHGYLLDLTDDAVTDYLRF